MINQTAVNQFLTTWRWRLSDRRGLANGFWEGQKALDDLTRTDYLVRVRIEEPGDPKGAFGCGLEHFVPTHALPKICALLAAYRRDLSKVKLLRESQKNQEEWLKQEAVRIRKKAKFYAINHPHLARRLNRIAKEVDEVRRGTQIQLRQRWRRPTVGIVFPFKGHRSLKQERELDSWFQVRLGSVMRMFLPKECLISKEEARGPTLRTIARLIVLFLVCSDLAEVEEHQVHLKHRRNPPVSVSGVFQQLHGAGIR